ncbi:2-hydroxychromene-2-carboxylate isomerase [Candidatus Pelagibacter ubique]|uniref:2-hydroxychromene-2-carboxylate isomerase n=2 Tax=Pelagibacter ubique TaxID=198252 RepID=A0ABX1T3Q3_PELUQ|nr:2-hydroxychromene-2-carboxylate isomerase [Candidatus Pelagibacter ubique]
MPKELIYMTKQIDFYFDFISPYSYLAHLKIKQIKNINFNYKPVLVGGLHNLQGITAPAFIKPKLKHMISDCDLIAKKDKFDFIWNSKFPINSLNIMRGYLFIINENKNLYLNLIFDAYWKDNLDISNEEVLKTLLKKCRTDSDSFFEGVKDPRIKDELKNITQEAHDKEIFGTPTFVVNNKIFWGQDRLDFALDEYNK